MEDHVKRASSFFAEFKEFAMKGNMVDMAVGIIIGATFGKIVSSLVQDVVLPPLALLTGGLDFSEKVIVLREATEEVPALLMHYGVFLNTLIDFIIIAFVIFLVIKQMNKLKREEPKKESTRKDCPHCFSSISIKATKCPHCTTSISGDNS